MEQELKSIAKKVALLEAGNISGLEDIADVLSSIIVENESELSSKFTMVAGKIQEYIEQLLTGQGEEIWPLEEGILLLRAIERSLRTDGDFLFEIREILNLLGHESITPFEEDNSNKINVEGVSEKGRDKTGEVKKELERIAKCVTQIKKDDIRIFGEILNSLEFIESIVSGEEYKNFIIISCGARKYTEKLILGEKADTELLEESIILMQALFRSIQKGEEFTFGIDEIVEKLGAIPETVNPSESQVPMAGEETIVVNSKPVKELDEEDLEILGDFILESRDNLESIEIHLIDLEQNPGDSETINAIFRPFHTIKGVSGFLDLRKINSLSHSTENLLDSARQGEFEIDNEITDVILQSVDMLKKLIDKVENGLDIGKSADDTDIKIEPLVRRIDNINAGEKHFEDKNKPVGEILIEKGKLKTDGLSKALDIQKQQPKKKLGEILVEENIVDSKEVISALRDQKRIRKTSTPQVKVDTNKLDNLVDLTGELVIAQSMLRQNTMAMSSGDQKLYQNLNQLGQIVSNIQKIAMSMRMVPIKATFQKMVRLVRDLAKNCNKEVALEMSGEDTEIDRNVVEALYEPMVHMIRNSIDHGLESAEDRVASGKPPKGKIRLQAYHKGGNIVIEIIDDGKGLNKMNILEKAMNSGLIESDSVLSDQEIFQLIMKPGFSTAKEITDISGRGVGMDVVKKAIESLNGRVDINSVEGQGSTVTISLPLTLAIIEGMLVRVGKERFIVPTMAILESFKPEKEDYFTVEGKGEMIMFRKSLIPIVRLNRICSVEMDNKNIWDNIVIVVENKKEQRGLLIDELLGKDEFVIKSLGESLKGIKGLAGGAIMSDGRVGLILDIGGLFEIAMNY